MSILSFIGLAALVLFGKFIWDTYITGKTDRDAEVQKKRNPEEAARMELTVKRGEYLNFDYSPKRSVESRAVSTNLLASLIGCEAQDLGRIYKAILAEEIMASNLDPIEFLRNKILELRPVKARDALKMNIDPDDTPAALMCEWASEMLEETTRQVELINYQNQVQEEKTRIKQEIRRICIADISETLECEESEVEEVFKSSITKDARELSQEGVPQSVFFASLKKQFQSEKQAQAMAHNLDEEYTPGSIKEQWLDEVIQDYEDSINDDYLDL